MPGSTKDEDFFTLTWGDIFFVMMTLSIAPYSKNVIQARKKFQRIMARYPDRGQAFVLVPKEQIAQQEETA